MKVELPLGFNIEYLYEEAHKLRTEERYSARFISEIEDFLFEIKVQFDD